MLPNHGIVGRLLSEQCLIGVEDVVLNFAECLAAGKDDEVAACREDTEGLVDDLFPEVGAPGDIPRVLTVFCGAQTTVFSGSFLRSSQY